MIKILKAAALSACILSAPGVFADCSEPDRPQLPDPANAVTPEMIKAKNEVKSYMSAADNYLSCKKLSRRKHDAMIDKMHTLAAEFNKVIKEFKKRVSG